MTASDENERELEREFLRVSPPVREASAPADDREQANATLRALEAQGGPPPLRSNHDD
jgi:hypothetical protein